MNEDRTNIVERQCIGMRVAEERRKRGLTQQQLADMTGMKQANIARIEAGRYSVRFDTLQAIAEAMGMKVDLITGR